MWLTDINTWKGIIGAFFWAVSSLSAALLINDLSKYNEQEYNERVIAFSVWLTMGNTVLIIIWACCTSREFKELFFHLSETHLHLQHYPKYVRETANVYTIVPIMLLIFYIIKATVSYTAAIMQMEISFWEIPFTFYWINAAFLAYLTRTGFGYLLFYRILKVLSVQLEFIAFDVAEISKSLLFTACEDVKERPEFVESLNKLCTCYTHTYESCRLINKIFSLPVKLRLMQSSFCFPYLCFLISIRTRIMDLLCLHVPSRLHDWSNNS